MIIVSVITIMWFYRMAAFEQLLAVVAEAVAEGVVESRTEKPCELQRTMRIKGEKRCGMKGQKKKCRRKKEERKKNCVWAVINSVWLERHRKKKEPHCAPLRRMA